MRGVCLAALLLVGCAGPREVAEHRAGELRWEVADAVIAADELPVREITWADAIDLLAERGPAVLRSNESVKRAEIAALRPYRNLIPTIDARAGIVEQVSTLGDLTADDIVYNIFVTNLLSGIVNLPEQVFLSRLALVRAELQRELAWREQVVVMHGLFLQSAALSERQRVAELTQLTAERAKELGVEAPPGARPDELDDLFDEIDRGRDELNARFGALLGEPAVRWVPVGGRGESAGVPRVDAAWVLGPGFEERLLESLRLRIAATELAAADARVTSGWLDYLPQPEIFLTAPPIFTQTSGNQTVFEFGNLTLTARLRLTLDFRGSIAERIKLAKLDREAALREARIAVRTAAVEARLLSKELERIDEDRVEAVRRLELLAHAATSDGLPALSRRVSAAARVRASLVRSEIERVSLVAPLLTLDKVWAETFPYADALTPGRPATSDDEPTTDSDAQADAAV